MIPNFVSSGVRELCPRERLSYLCIHLFSVSSKVKNTYIAEKPVVLLQKLSQTNVQFLPAVEYKRDRQADISVYPFCLSLC